MPSSETRTFDTSLSEVAAQLMLCQDTFVLLSNDYLVSVERLLKFPVEAAFPGHERILDGDDLQRLIVAYIESKSG